MTKKDETVTKPVRLTRMLEPSFLSLVDRPANQLTFKILRDDKGKDMAIPQIKRSRVSRSATVLVCIEFPDTATEDEIAGVMSDFGIEDYEVTVDAENRKKRIKCNDATEGAETITVRLAGDTRVTFLKPISNSTSDGPKALVVSEIRFSTEYFPDAGDHQAWCTKNHIDISSATVQNGDCEIVLCRAEVDKGAEVRRMEVDSGVVFTVVRADTQDVPQDFIDVVNERAFGHWGWGQLDFNAKLADVEFSEAAREAMRLLEDVLYDILYYSELPLEVRKTLMDSALSQYSQYIGTLMDALPARVVIAFRSDQSKETPMLKATTAPAPAATAAKPAAAAPHATSDEAATAAESEAATNAAATGGTDDGGSATPADGPITRADVDALISGALSGITEQLAALTASLTPPAAPVTRTDEPPAGDTPAATPAAEDPQQQVLRSISELGGIIKGVSERMQALEGATITRSDGGDGKQTSVGRKDVFQGIFSRSRPAA